MAPAPESPDEKAHRLVLQTVVTGVMDELVKAIKAEGLTGVGFAVMLFDFGDGGSFAYASNADRSDFIKLLREAIPKLERQ